MPRSAGVSVENNFSRGLITETTGTNSPENSVVETVNVIYDRKARALKRPPFDYEDLNTFLSIPYEGVKTEYVWETVVDGTSTSFVVVQFGRYIRFFRIAEDSGLSSNLESFSVDLNTFRVPANPLSSLETNSASFASGNGLLFVTHSSCEPFWIKYNSDTNDIETQQITIEIRDFRGVDDGLAVNERPNTLSEEHKYNLFNQGWYAAVNSGHDNVLHRAQNPRPSNADIWYLSRFINNRDSLTLYSFDWARRDMVASGKVLTSTRAPRGHYIFNAFRTQRTGITGEGDNAPTVGTVPEEVTNVRPSCVAFYTGRVFYSGVPSDGYSNKIYFSQILEGEEEVGRCYQGNDPTAEDGFDIIASDGGVISVLDLSQVVSMVVIGTTLYVFGTNGVWSITGADRGPFKATDYVVSKVSNFPALSRSSIVNTGSVPIWWNYEGIYTVAGDPLGETTVQSLSDSTIKTFYNEISQVGKKYAKGAFNDQENAIYWLYSATGLGDPYLYDSVLVFDLSTSGFYTYSISGSTQRFMGLVAVRGVSEQVVLENVLDENNVVVTVDAGEAVTIESLSPALASTKRFKFLTLTEDEEVTFSDLVLNPTNYRDWDEVEFPAHFVTGYRIRGNLMKHSQTNYLVVVTEEAPLASVFVRGVWDYTTAGSPQKLSQPQECYFRRGLMDYHSRKLKMRGRGRSLQFRFDGVPNLPFIIVGWAGFETTEEMP